MARGRPSKPGKRHKCGKRISATPYDHGADHVAIARSRFARFHDGKATQQVYDPIGRAWAVGLLENHRFDPAVLRDAGREYAAAFFGHYPTNSGVANYEGEDRRQDAGIIEPIVRLGVEVPRDGRGQWFRRIDSMLDDAGFPAAYAAKSLCCDCYATPDANPPWLERLINDRLAKAGVAVFGQLSVGGDMEMARQAIEGLIALCEGTKPSRQSLAA